jgi:trans-aconitate 2-methyltransferase
MTEWNAQEYARQSSLQAAMAQEQLSQLQLQGQEKVLDIGCGDGKITAAIAARLPHGSILGIDPSQQMIAFARDHFGPERVANLRFELADVRFLTFDSEFDRVVSFNALHWVSQQDLALKSILKALKPRGQAELRFVGLGDRPSLESIITETCQTSEWQRYFADFQQPYIHFTPSEYQRLAQRNGFQVLNLELVDKAWDFGSRAAFQAFCQATFVEWTKQLPADQHLNFINQVLNRYQHLVADSPAPESTFEFYQLVVKLCPDSQGERG